MDSEKVFLVGLPNSGLPTASTAMRTAVLDGRVVLCSRIKWQRSGSNGNQKKKLKSSGDIRVKWESSGSSGRDEGQVIEIRSSGN